MEAIDGIDDPAALRALMRASLALEGDLNLHVVLRALVEQARSLVGARFGLLAVFTEQGDRVDRCVTSGFDDDADVPPTSVEETLESLASAALAGTAPVRRTAVEEDPSSFGFPRAHPPIDSLLAVTVSVNGRAFGQLILTNRSGGDSFSEQDESLVAALAEAAGRAIENARLYTVLRDRTLTEDRDRIARDLHDSIIQRLFAVGLSLQGTTQMTDQPEVVSRIADAVNKLDETIRQLRTAIFDLEVTINQDGLRRKVHDLLFELAPVVGSHPQVTFSGMVDSGVSTTLTEDVLSTLREALTNVGKHANASHVVVTVAVGDELRLVVVDDGNGLGEARGDGLGLKNMRRRAERRGGSLELGTSREGGTRLTWKVPNADARTSPTG